MQNDSIETLLSRHYGSGALAPSRLEDRLHASIRQEALEIRAQERVAEHLRQRRFSRRRAVKLVALGTAGVGVASLGMEALHMLEAALTGQDVSSEHAYP
jgi:hypothetical protein